MSKNSKAVKNPPKGSAKSGAAAKHGQSGSKPAQGGQRKGKPAKPAGALSGPTPKTTTAPTREEVAAVTIQCAVRQLLARRARAQKLKEKGDYDALMDRLEKEAFVELVRREQEEAERERQKEDEERKRKKAEQQLRARLLEAAFDGEEEEVLAVLKEVTERDTKSGIGFDEAGQRRRLLNQIRMVNMPDANGNTAVSEAAAGGQPNTVALLAEKGADVNTKGAFGRTPLFRAAFGGHLGALQTLLQLGADPRIHADDGCTPEQVASEGAVVSFLQSWDLSLTDSLLVEMEAEQERRAAEGQEQQKALTDRLRGEVEQLQKEQERCQRELHRTHVELEKRISEHDKCTRKGMDASVLEVTLQVVHDAEDALVKAKMAAEQTAQQLGLAKLELREQSGGDAVTEHGGIRCLVRDLEEVLLRDVGGKIKQDGRWPLLVDSSGQATIFLRYRDTNYVNVLNPEDMQPDKLRLALLGAIRFGKPLVIDMMELDLFDAVEGQLEQVKPGLSKELISKELLQQERYLGIVQSSDGPQYDRTEFRAERIESFRLVVTTKQRHPADNLLTTFYPIEVTLPGAKS